MLSEACRLQLSNNEFVYYGLKSNNNLFVTFLTAVSKFVIAVINHQAGKRLNALFQTTTAHPQPHTLTSFHFSASLFKKCLEFQRMVLVSFQCSFVLSSSSHDRGSHRRGEHSPRSLPFYSSSPRKTRAHGASLFHCTRVSFLLQQFFFIAS